MVPLKKRHTFGFDSCALSLVELTDVSMISDIFGQLGTSNYYLLGEGSNSIFLEDFCGVVVLNKLMGVNKSEDDTNVYLRVASGESWHKLVETTLSMGAFGFENLALIPGTVGAAPIQNIGAYGVEIERFIESVECFDIKSNESIVISKDNCQFAYRDSIFKHELFQKVVITAVNFVLPKNNIIECSYAPLNELVNPTPQDIFQKVIEVRKQKLPDPSKLGNAGSFFKNPVVSAQLYENISKQFEFVPHFRINESSVKIPAAWLIDQLGFKGKMYSGVKCHEKQPLVLVNTGNGNGEGLLMLAREIKREVYKTFSIELENEVRLVGTHGLIDL